MNGFSCSRLTHETKIHVTEKDGSSLQHVTEEYDNKLATCKYYITEEGDGK